MPFKNVITAICAVLILLSGCAQKDPVAISAYAPGYPSNAPVINRALLKVSEDYTVGYANGHIRSDQVTLTWTIVNVPDFLCYRAGEFKFVECKLDYEQLSYRQKKCIQRLHVLGYPVEIHKTVTRSKRRLGILNIDHGRTAVTERQASMKCFKGNN